MSHNIVDEAIVAVERATQELDRLHRINQELLAALNAVTVDMDRAGGDGYGMPACPWCQSQREDNEHDADCELLIARAAIARAEGR